MKPAQTPGLRPSAARFTKKSHYSDEKEAL